MRPIRLYLRGFKGIRAGLGVNEIEIDFTKMPVGLIAVVGRNGGGKTTILDNLHPYRLMPYKLRDSKSGWTPDAFSYYGQCDGRDASKCLVFEQGGKFYKSELMIDAERRKMESYLSESPSGNPDGPFVPINDGKNGTYDEAIEQVCGSPNLFFTSAFQSQGAKNLSSYTRGDIMSIIGELLELGHIREQGEKAKKVADTLANDSATLFSKMEDLTASIDRAESENDKLREINSQIDAKESIIDGIKKDIDSERERLHDLEKRNADFDAQMDKVKAAESELLIAESHLTDVKADIQSVENSRDKAVQRFVVERERIEKDKERLQKIIDNGTTVRAKADEYKDRKEVLDGHKAKLVELETERDELAPAVKELSTAKTNLYNAEGDLRDKSERVSVLGELDCKADGSGWINEACPLLTNAIKAKEMIEVVEKDIANYKQAITDCEPKSVRYNEVDKEIATVRGAIKDLEVEIAEIERYSRLLPELESAESGMTEIVEREKRCDADEASVQSEYDSKLSDLNVRLNKQAGVVEKIKERVAAEKEGLDKGYADQITRLKDGMKRLDDDLKFNEGKVRELLVESGRIKEAISSADDQRKKRSELQEKFDLYQNKISDYALLAKACSNDGIIALEIDDAGPTISALANDLLNSCYGTRFAIRFETQGAKTDGGMKEVFDITVFDSERNEEKSIKEMSGGEVTWIEDAIRRAICLLNIQRSDRSYDTMFSDEKDGALDATRKGEFFAIKRRAMEIGTHHHEFFISQTPDLQEQADGQITLGGGRAETSWESTLP